MQCIHSKQCENDHYLQNIAVSMCPNFDTEVPKPGVGWQTICYCLL